jgi:hypothetical protein
VAGEDDRELADRALRSVSTAASVQAAVCVQASRSAQRMNDCAEEIRFTRQLLGGSPLQVTSSS